mgnify:CR=1 FL=1
MALIDDEVFAAILAPIDGSVGTDGREDEGEAGELLREMRSQRRALVRGEQSAAIGENVTGDDALSWSAVADQAVDYLIRFGKDLEVAALLIEALVREEGPAGLARAMELLAELVEAFWDQGLYPPEDEDGVEARFMPLSGLSGGGGDRDGALIQPVRRMVLMEAGGSTLSFLDKVRSDAMFAAAQSGSPEQKAAKAEEAAALSAELDAITERLSRPVLEKAAGQVTAAEQHWRRAIAYISERTKPRFPAASRLSSELQAMGDWLGVLIARLPEVIAPTEDSGAADGAGEEQGGSTAVAVANPGDGFSFSGRISRREDALRAISLAADYFSTYEPLSPLGVTLREVDRRARMSLHALMTELIPDESAREIFYWRSGIRPPAAEE